MKHLKKLCAALCTALFLSPSVCVANTGTPQKKSEESVQKPFAGIEVVKRDDVWVLDLSNRGLDDLKGLTAIQNIEKVQKLLLYKNNLAAVPDEVFMLPHLEELDLSHNSLSSLSSKVQRLQKLVTLNVSHNMLSGLPKTIGNLSKLKNIYLECNELTTLPDELGRLSNLRVLLANDNRIAHVPEVVSKLLQLCVIDVSNNNISQLSDELLSLKSTCKMLSLGNNPLKKTVREKLRAVPDCFDILTGVTA